MNTIALAVLAFAIASPAIAHTTQAPAAAEAAQPADASQLYALILGPGPAWKPGKPFEEQGLKTHFHYWMELFRAGRIATAGPLDSDSGLILLFAGDRAEAEAVLGADPAIEAGIFEGTVRRYVPPMVNADALKGVQSDARR